MVRPRGVVLLEATTGAAVHGPSFRVGAQPGCSLHWPEQDPAPDHLPEWVVATAHPSSVLRSRSRDEDFRRLVADLGVVADLAG